MKEYKVPIQSLIDHIKTSLDVDPWAKEMAEELLKEQEAVEPRLDANCVRMFHCGACGEYVGFIDSDTGDPNEQDNYCRNCGRKVKWNERIHRASNSTRND